MAEKHWSIGARYRIALGQAATAPTITIGLNYGSRSFKVDRSQLMVGNLIDLPDVSYLGFMPGVTFRLPLGVPAVALVFGGRIYLLKSAGDIQSLAQYGQATVTGGEGMAGLDIVLGSRVAIRITGELAVIGFAFKGNGAMANNRDGDPASPDVGGASDRYIGGAATLAVLY